MTSKTSVGEVRPSQLIYSYGVGAIIDLPKMSVIVTGLEDWSTNPEYVAEIVEDRLLNAVRYHHPKVTQLLKPPFVPEDSLPGNPFNSAARIGVPVATFPRWLVCPRCHLLSHVSSGLFKLKENPYYPDRTVYRHINCSDDKNKNPEVFPARFLVVCSNGHMDDFPWLSFVHHQHECTGKPLLRLQEFGATGQARALEVRCDTCKQKRRLSDAFGKDNLKNMPQCTGRRPHLRDYDDDCTQTARPMILGASNMWFPVTLSTVAIPVDMGKLEKLVDEKWMTLKDAINIGVITFLRTQGNLGAELSEYSDDEIWALVENRRQASAQDNVSEKAPDLRAPEWEILSKCDTSLNNDDFHIRPIPIDANWQFSDVIDQVIIVERLRETQALIGFTRIDSAGEFSDPQAKISIEPAPISRNALTWVPADEVRGEGIFIQFNEAAIARWEKKKAVENYLDKFFNAHVKWRKARRIQPVDQGFPGMRYVLLHSFAHILMQQLALESGYSVASIRERIYSRRVGDEYGPMAGMLIYTAASDSEGTLGGLAQLGEAPILESHIRQALENAHLCASDPLCAENQPGHDSRTIHGSACHVCLFAPETSCERGNKYLDRSLLIPTLERDDLAFFQVH